MPTNRFRLALTSLLLCVPLESFADGVRHTSEFAAMTELPWTKEHASPREVIETIFRDPRRSIRYTVLREYLRRIPVESFELALPECIEFEGLQCPAAIVSLVLDEWVRRDPEPAFKKTMELLELSISQGGPYQLSRWDDERLSVASLEAFRASSFYLTPDATFGFVKGMQDTSGPEINRNAPARGRRIEMLKAYSQRYIEIFADTPQVPVDDDPDQPSDPASDKLPPSPYGSARSGHIISAFSVPESKLSEALSKGGDHDAEVIAGCWLSAQPSRAAEIFKALEAKLWDPRRYEGPPHGSGEMMWLERLESTRFWFVPLWKRLDKLGMLKWAEAQTEKSDLLYAVLGVLIGEMDDANRKRWFKRSMIHEDSDRSLNVLLVDQWAIWDPAGALDAITAKRDQPMVEVVVESLGGGDYDAFDNPQALEFVAKLELQKYPFFTREFLSIGEDLVDDWIDKDVAKAARVAVKVITTPEGLADFPRSKIVELFMGAEPLHDHVHYWQCLSALRFWAIWKPEEMRAWIPTVQGDDMQRALTWLLEHPGAAGQIPDDVAINPNCPSLLRQ